MRPAHAPLMRQRASVLRVPARAAQLALELLVKINSELSRKDRGCDHYIRELLADIVRGTEAEALTHRSPQTFDALARTLG
jgi:hypothetical protein